jgi:hypothetical protein
MSTKHRNQAPRKSFFVPRSVIATAGMSVGLGVIPICSSFGITACSASSSPAIGIEPCICDFDASVDEAGDGALVPDANALIAPDAASDGSSGGPSDAVGPDVQETGSGPALDASGADQ